jgi:hypothetical protein
MIIVSDIGAIQVPQELFEGSEQTSMLDRCRCSTVALAAFGSGFLSIPDDVFLNVLISSIEKLTLQNVREVRVVFSEDHHASLKQVRAEVF